MPTDMPIPLSDMIGDFSGDDILERRGHQTYSPAAIQMGSVHPQYDLIHSGAASILEDHQYWVTEIKQTWMGDANLDG